MGLVLRSIAVAALLALPIVAHAQTSATPVAGAQPVSLTDTAANPTSAVDLTPDEKEYIRLINRDRVAHGLGALDVDPMLVRLARQHSREMCDRSYFDHYSPVDGQRTPLDRYVKAIQAANCDMPEYALVGENIYYSSRSDGKYTVAYGHNALMNSPHHRENILEPKFQKVGVGLYIAPTGAVWVTEEFLRDVPIDTPIATGDTTPGPRVGAAP